MPAIEGHTNKLNGVFVDFVLSHTVLFGNFKISYFFLLVCYDF